MFRSMNVYMPSHAHGSATLARVPVDTCCPRVPACFHQAAEHKCPLTHLAWGPVVFLAVRASLAVDMCRCSWCWRSTCIRTRYCHPCCGTDCGVALKRTTPGAHLALKCRWFAHWQIAQEPKSCCVPYLTHFCTPFGTVVHLVWTSKVAWVSMCMGHTVGSSV
jgi:hypothetical protein